MESFKRIVFLGIAVLQLSWAGDKPSYPKAVNKAILEVWNARQFNLTELPVEIAGGKIFQCTLSDTLAGYVYLGRVNSCKPGGCSPDEGQEIIVGEYEYFDYLVLFNTQRSVEEVKIYNYAATYGVQITSKAWLRQFEGYAGQEPLNYGKEIDAISGATVSALSLIADLQRVTLALAE